MMRNRKAKVQGINQAGPGIGEHSDLIIGVRPRVKVFVSTVSRMVINNHHFITWQKIVLDATA
jgi:hypothetical protein